MGPCVLCLMDEEFSAETVHDGVGESRFDVEDVAEFPISSELELWPVFAKKFAPARY